MFTLYSISICYERCTHTHQLTTDILTAERRFSSLYNSEELYRYFWSGRRDSNPQIFCLEGRRDSQLRYARELLRFCRTSSVFFVLLNIAELAFKFFNYSAILSITRFQKVNSCDKGKFFNTHISYLLLFLWRRSRDSNPGPRGCLTISLIV